MYERSVAQISADRAGWPAVPECPEPPQRRSGRVAGGPAKAANGGRLGKRRAAEQHQVRQASREDRWRLRRVAQRITRMDRLQGCGRRRCRAGDSVGVLWSGQGSSARLTGIQSCGSVWACPCCAAKIAAQRSEEVGRALAVHLDASPEHRIGFLTLTVRHRRDQGLSEVWNEVTAAWAAVHRTASWRGGARMVGDQERFRISGWVKGVEVTHGENGWHAHAHVAILLDGSLTCEEQETLGNRVFDRWSAACERKGFAAPSRKHGVDLVMVGGGSKQESAASIGKYLVKSGLALEVVGGQAMKTARAGNRTPWQILGDIARERAEGKDCTRDVAIWREWESGSKGRRQIAWSAGLRQRLLRDREQSDQEIAAGDPIMPEEVLVGTIPGRSWSEQGARDDLEMRADLLKSVEACKTAHEAVAIVPEVLERHGYSSRPLTQPLCVEAPTSRGECAEKIARKRVLGEKSVLFTPDFDRQLTIF